MPVAAYPSISTLKPIYFDELEPEYQVTKSPQFSDGGCDFNLDADQKIRRWVMRYGVNTEAEAAPLDTHVDSAKYNSDVGSAYSFSFTDRAGVTHSGVRYAPGGFRRSHTKTWIQAREVLLVKYP